jgi:hypothetical protein
MNASHAPTPVLVLFAVLVLLVMAGIWGFGPLGYIRLVGNEAQGVIYHVNDCGTNDDGDEAYQETVVFRDAKGQLQESTSGSTCTNDFANGETHAIWYLPALPGSAFIGGPGGRFYIVSAVWLVLVVTCLVSLFLMTRARVRACIQAENFARLWQGGLGCLVMVLPLLVLLHFFPPSPDQGQSGPAHNFRAGETVAVDGRWAISVQPVRPAAQSGGTVCLELDVTLRNTTQQAQSVAVSQFTLFDGEAQEINPSCSVDAPKLSDSQVAPGAVIMGALAFKAPASLRECYLAFRPGTPEENVGRYFWRLQVTSAGSGS